MEVKGFLKGKVGSQTGTSQRSDSDWQTDEWLLYIPGMYEKHIKLDVRGVDRCKQWDEFYKNMPNKDSYVLVKFEINAHEYKGRWFNNVEAWDISIAQL